ncbi:hypothetical protein SAMN05216311_108226 [Chitinophaga sp. CF418]|nr:hypothetical protein SAMN05216311_108226 [Chitinophaga sp. CF418]
MENSDSLDLSTTITFIKIFNTIAKNRELKRSDPKYQVFEDLFRKKYLDISCKVIEGDIGRGMSYYSKKHDLYIGGPVHLNSQYHIIDP